MNRRTFIGGSIALSTLPRLATALPRNATPQRGDPLELWCDKSATRWLEALPIGNGKSGGMIYGDPSTERIALSDSTAWSGAPATGETNPGALAHLEEIRQLFFAGKYDEAQELCNKYLPGRWKNFGSNQPLPELQLAFENITDPGGYRRSLSLDDAIARVNFRAGGIDYSREFLATHADGVIVIRLTADKGGAVTFRAGFGETALPTHITNDSDKTLLLDGHCYERKHSTGHDGVAFQIRVHVLHEGGQASATASSLEIRSANAATILIAIGTSYDHGDPVAETTQAIARASAKSYPQLRSAHLADYQPLYRRVIIQLGDTPLEVRNKPTEIRRKSFVTDPATHDPELLALFFQYGRYLTIAGSRADSPLPLALQGLWNDGLASNMGWTDDFHLDINTEQNYWPAEVTNLSECQLPLFQLIEKLRIAGRTTAREMYGAPGWVVHTVTNPWGFTSTGSPGWGIFVTSGIWISLQLWDHYTFNGNIDFLRTRAYPILRELAEFYLAYMVVEPKHGWLVTGPSDSPENWYVSPTGSGRHIGESMGNTIDRCLVHGLYSRVIDASETLNVDADLRVKLEAARSKLPPLQIGKHGQLQEWLEDFEEGVPNHRHTSHLVSVYPLHQISPRATPDLARAAEITIQRRVSAPDWEQTEWGRANFIVYYARLLNGDAAYNELIDLVAHATDDNMLTYSAAGVAGADTNIFAIDGNTAGTASIAEMLLQSQAGELVLLPALPSACPTGNVRGLCARGGYVVDIEWRDGHLVSAAILNRRGTAIPVRYNSKVYHLKREENGITHLTAKNFSV